jgi:hypothetical protein
MVDHLKAHLKATKVGWVEDEIEKRDVKDVCDCCGKVVEKYPYKPEQDVTQFA